MQRVIVFVVLLLGTPLAHAQSATYGAIHGRVHAADGRGTAGITVTATGARDAHETETAADGTFRFEDLLPGEYTVMVAEVGRAVVARHVYVAAMRDTQLDMLASSVVGFVADREALRDVPHAGRFANEVLGATPGSRGDDYGVAFFDASSADNRWVLDGVDTTKVRYGFGGTALPVELLQDVSVTTVGVPVDITMGTGAVIGLITPSGTNDFHGSVFGVVAPGFLQGGAQTDHVPRTTETIKITPDRVYDTTFGFELGGPIVRDHAWFHIGLAPQLRRTDYQRTIQSETDCRKVEADGSLSPCDARYQDGSADVDPKTGAYIVTPVDSEVRTSTSRALPLLGKIDVALSPTHRGAVSAFVVPSRTDSPGLYGAPSTGSRVSELTSDVGGHWTSWLFDDSLRVDAQVGWHREKIISGSVDSTFDARALTSYTGTDLAQLAALGGESATTAALCSDGGPQDRFPRLHAKCPVDFYPVGGPGSLVDDLDDRRHAELALDEHFGAHDVKVGASARDDYVEEARVYSGGKFVVVEGGPTGMFPSTTTFQHINVAAANDPDPRFDKPCKVGALDARCQIVGGIPGEPGTLVNAETVTWATFARDVWQPRADLAIDVGVRYERQRLLYPDDLRGAIDPFTGARNGDTAVSLNGSVAPRVAVTYDPSRDGRAKLLASWGRYIEPLTSDLVVDSFSRAGLHVFEQAGTKPVFETYGAPEQVRVAPSLSPGYVDQLVLAAEYSPAPGAVAAATAMHRSLGREIDDVTPSGAGTLVLANPGEGVASGFDKPRRDYDALILSFAARLSHRIGVQASYTYSRTTGNYPGTIDYDDAALLPHRSPQFDLIELLANRFGRLPQDRPHYFKIDAFYVHPIGDESSAVVGVRYRASSGTPVDALGAHFLYGENESFLLPRGALGRTPFTTGLDLHVAYRHSLPYGTSGEVFIDVINLLDSQDIYTVDQTYTGDFGYANPIAGGTLGDLVWLKRVGSAGDELRDPVTRNPRFLQPTGRYAPRYAMLGARLSF